MSDMAAFFMMASDRAGELVESGPTAQIFTNPRDKRTEDYIPDVSDSKKRRAKSNGNQVGISQKTERNPGRHPDNGQHGGQSHILAVEALKKRDLALANQIIADDKKINRKRFEIEEKCIQLIATQQPMASDLRTIVSVLNIITELERIGDYAEGNAKITIMIGNEPPLKPLMDMPRMAEKTVDMLNRSLTAFIDQRRGGSYQNHRRRRCHGQSLRPGIPRTADLYDGGPKDSYPRHATHMGDAQPRAQRRPRDQYLRTRGLYGHRQDGRKQYQLVLLIEDSD